MIKIQDDYNAMKSTLYLTKLSDVKINSKTLI